MYKNPVKSYDVCIKNRHATEKTCTLCSLAYAVCFYRIQGRQNSQVARIICNQDTRKKRACCGTAERSQEMLVQGLALWLTLADWALFLGLLFCKTQGLD